jgi:WD40 repeat protein
MPSPINCLLQTSQILFVIGLESGQFWGWNLQNNTFAIMQPQPHPAGVSVLELCTIENQPYMMSGYKDGCIKLFNASGFNVFLQGQVQNDRKSPLQIAVTSLIAIKSPITSGFLIAASDVSGQITLLSANGKCCTFSAHSDIKNAPINIRQLILLPDTQKLVSVGEAPLMRLWDK